MPRLTYGLEIADMSNLWASAGDPLPPEDPSINLPRPGGFTPAMSLPGGPPVPRQLFSWSWRVFSTLGSEVNQHGLLEWSDEVNYLHTASVAKNGRAFISTVNSGPGVPIGPVDPELAGQTVWVELLRVGQLRWNDIDGVLTISKGGTGASSADGARNALDAAERGHSHSGFAPDPHTHPVASLDDLFGTLSIGKGGTGADSPSGARASLGAAAAIHTHAGSELTVVIGAVVWWPGLFTMIPEGWREADGAAISRSTYSVAFSALGTTWGSGNGSTTFNIPNYQGRMLVGKRAADSVGDTGGARAVSLTSANLGAHTHALAPHSHSTPGHSHDIGSHQHTVSGHSHSGASHLHALSNHSHNIPGHGHTVSDHSHSGASHSHSLSNHSHSVPGHNHGYDDSTRGGVTRQTANYSPGGSTFTGVTVVATTNNARTTAYSGSGSTGSSGSGSTGSASGSTGLAGGGATSSIALTADPGGSVSTGSASGSTGSAGGGATSSVALTADPGGSGSTGSASGANTGSAGSGTPHENMPPFAVGYWIIKIE